MQGTGPARIEWKRGDQCGFAEQSDLGGGIAGQSGLPRSLSKAVWKISQPPHGARSQGPDAEPAHRLCPGVLTQDGHQRDPAGAAQSVRRAGRESSVRPLLFRERVPGAAGGQTAVPHQRVRGAVPAEHKDGKADVQRQEQGGGEGDRLRDAGDQLRRERVDQPDGDQAQNAPEKGEKQTDPAVEVQRKMGIIPEGDPQHPVIEEVHEVLRSGGGQGGPQKQQPGIGTGGGQGQHQKHAQPVHRAERQEIEAFSIPFGIMGDSREDHLH